MGPLCQDISVVVRSSTHLETVSSSFERLSSCPMRAYIQAGIAGALRAIAGTFSRMTARTAGDGLSAHAFQRPHPPDENAAVVIAR